MIRNIELRKLKREQDKLFSNVSYTNSYLLNSTCRSMYTQRLLRMGQYELSFTYRHRFFETDREFQEYKTSQKTPNPSDPTDIVTIDQYLEWKHFIKDTYNQQDPRGL